MLPSATLREPPGFFAFRWCPAEPIVDCADFAFVYKVPGSLEAAAFADLIENVCRGPIVPDVVVLVHVREDPSNFLAFLETPQAVDALIRFKERLPLISVEIGLSSFRIVARVILPKRWSNGKELRVKLQASAPEWLNAGLSKVFSPDRVIIQAPSGFAFHKPSKTRSSHFIRAEQGLSTSGSVSFVALATLHRLHQRFDAPIETIRHFFVDTMGVATVAYGLRELLALSGSPRIPPVESFHSYEGIDEVRSPLPASSVCLISASTSMGMHRDWVKKKRVRDEDVLTLVTYEGVPDSDRALYRIPREHQPNDEGVSANYDIQIKGENFVPSAEPPRFVLLSKPHHASTTDTDIFRDLTGGAVFDLYRSGSAGSAPRGLFVDGSALLKHPTFRSFYQRVVAQHVKASTRCVVHQPDEPSAALAKAISLEMATRFGLKAPAVISSADISSEAVSRHDGLVAVACVAGRGSELLAISRSLRGIHDGPRLYLIGVQVAETRAQLDTFDKNVCHSAEKASIEIARFGSAATGASLLLSFEEEHRALRLGQIATRRSSQLATRYTLLSDTTASRLQRALLPVGPLESDTLRLRKDFAFWRPGYDLGAYQAEVVATIAVLLQRARENPKIESKHRLFSPVVGQVALDPENFTRYDDGLIQASILRAALPSELDYRGDKNSSLFVRDFLIRMSRHVGTERCEAMLEFLLSLSTRKMQLKPEHATAVQGAFLESVRRPRSALAGAVRSLCQRISPLAGNGEVEPFGSL